MAIVKHFIGNTQETDRTTVNELVDETLLMELYGPPFNAAVQRAAGVMCAYNLVGGVYACENPLTLRTILRGRYNFSGFVVCACAAPAHSHPPSAAPPLPALHPSQRLPPSPLSPPLPHQSRLGRHALHQPLPGGGP